MPQRTPAQERLDTEVATRLMGFRWVEWSVSAEGPLYEPGRFLARPRDLTSNLHREVGADRPLHEQPLARVPRYSARMDAAMAAAESAGLFVDGKATLFRDPDGTWVIEVRGLRLESRALPELVCRAALEWSAAGERQ